LVWFGLVWFGLVWFGLVCSGEASGGSYTTGRSETVVRQTAVTRRRRSRTCRSAYWNYIDIDRDVDRLDVGIIVSGIVYFYYDYFYCSSGRVTDLPR